MKTVIQRVSSASVTINKKTVSEIKTGLLILVGIENEDTTEDIDWPCRPTKKEVQPYSNLEHCSLRMIKQKR